MDMSARFPWRNRDLASHLESLQDRIEQADNSIFIDVFDLESLPSHEGELSGALVSIKSTFDVLGYPTSGGTKILNQGIAQANAEVVTRLISAGAKLVGHTNMTELAYSGLGLNPHYGTPDNPLLPGRIPGGSTSGGAVSVALNLADIALGTDTGGSLRIPAAFCGLTGFKPTQDSVSRQGCLPLSNELDSVGAIARDVASCRQAWEVLSGKQADETQDPIYLVVPTNFGFDDLDPIVKEGFEQALANIESLGIIVERRHIPQLDDYKELPVWQFSAVESRRAYQLLFDLNSDQLDPRVRKRMARGTEVSDEDFMQTCVLRDRIKGDYQAAERNTFLLMPTVACLPPTFESLEDDGVFDQMNLLCLRNTTLANVLDGCSISLPYQSQGMPIGIMLTACHGRDADLLAVAEKLETVFS